jgi:PAS domain S-box-containing protein
MNETTPLNLQAGRILIVEDDEVAAEFISLSMKRKGYHICDILSSGEDAVRRVEIDRPDLILMDIGLEGDMDGIEAAQQIHSQLNIPVIFLSATIDDERLERAKITQPYGYLIKSFDDRELHSSVEIALYRSHMEKRLKESEKQYRNLVENISEVIYSMDEKGIVTYVSPAFEDAVGYGASDMVGRSFEKIVDPPDWRRIRKGLTMIEAGSNAPYEFRIRTLSGERRWVRSYSKAILENGSFAGIRGVLTDVTEQKRAKEELQKENLELGNRVRARTEELLDVNKKLRLEVKERLYTDQQLRLLSSAVDQTDEGIAIVDLKGRILFLNPAVALMHGYGADLLVNREFSVLYPGDQAESVKTADRHLMETGEFSGEFWHVRKNGKRFPVWIRNSLMREDGGQIIARIVILRDMTDAKRIEAELKKSRKQLVQAQKMESLGTLVAGVAHEINNPNNFITFNIPILKEYVNEILPVLDAHAEKNSGFSISGMPYIEFRNDIFNLLGNIEHGSMRINRIVSNLTEFSRGKENPCSEWVDPSAVIGKAEALCQGKIKKNVKTFSVVLSDTLPRILTDPNILEQVLVNLLINAAQAADKEDSWIRVKAGWFDETAGEFMIEVRDNGHGIKKRFIDRIFDPFFTTRALGEGTGLGLSISHSLVENIGGRLEVESKFGKGSIFRVVLNVPKESREKT